MHQRNARGVGHVLLLAAFGGIAHAQDTVWLRTLELEREHQPVSPQVWTLPLAELVDPAHLKGWPARLLAAGHVVRINRPLCALGWSTSADIELIGLESAEPQVRIWTTICQHPADSYFFTIGLEAQPRQPQYSIRVDADARTLEARPLGIEPPTAQLREVCLRFDSERREDTYKSYDELFVPYRGIPLTKGSGGSYPHHRGVFLGWSKVRAGDRTLDFWHCKAPATIRHDRFEPEHAWLGNVHATLERRLRWCDQDEAVVQERRRVTCSGSWYAGQFLDYEIELLAFQPIELDGDPHHGGFQIRAAQEVHDNPSATEFVRPADSHSTGNDIWSGGRWCAIRFPLAGETQQIAMLDHPQNGDPPQWSTRAYGRFGAFRRHTLQPGVPLVLRYRLIVASDSAYTRFTPQFLDARWREWIEPPVPKILR